MADVLLIGKGPTAPSALAALATKFGIVGVVRDADTGVESTDPVVRRARELGVRMVSETSRAAVEALLRDLKPDCVVVSSYDRILSPDVIARCPFVNVHYAPLPRYRGRASVNWAILNNEPWAAITIHTLVPELDAGNILFQERIPIGTNDTVADIYERLNELQREHLAETVVRRLDGYEGVPQDARHATYGCSRVPEDGEIDWSASTEAIHRLVRALVAPFPGAYTYFEGRRLVVWRAAIVEDPPRYEGRVPGRVVGVSRTHGYVDVLTGDGILQLREVQPDGESPLAAAEVIRSVRGTLGLRTADLLARIHLLEQRIAAPTGDRHRC
jgi:methionyl-tRNA formyltransferase